MEKKAILLTHFGTSHLDTLQKNILAVEKEAQAAFPGWEMRRAFTSGMILRIMKNQGITIASVPEALEDLLTEEFTDVIVQPSHLICGEEYDKLRGLAEPYRQYFKNFSIGKPLLASTEDMREVCRFYDREFPRDSDAALVLMGHGTPHFANAVYPAMNYLLKEMGMERILIGTVEGYPDIEVIRKELKQLGVKRVIVTPMMLVAGDHAINDMNGDGKDSWKSLLLADGYQVKTVLRGLGEYPEIRKLYLRHIREAIGEGEDKV